MPSAVEGLFTANPESMGVRMNEANGPTIDLHHVHLFASDIDMTVAWWCRHLGAKVFFDEVLAGSRNVFVGVGIGRLHIYDQPPKDRGRGAIHHLGLRVRGLRDHWARLQQAGIASPGGLREHGSWRYVMIEAPDGILLELFEFDDPFAAVNRTGQL